MCDKYLLNFHKSDLIKILNDQDVTKHFSININFIVLYENEPDIAVEIFKTPEKSLEEWDNATLKAQLVLLQEVKGNAQLKSHVHCRIHQLPVISEVRRTIFPGNNEAGNFLQVSGTVMRISAAKLLEYQRNYVCIKCKYSMLVKAEYDRKYMIKQPRKCLNPEDCSGTNLVTFGELDSDNCKDYQEVRIQEQVNKLGVGCMPNTMCVTLEDDLVDSCKPGDSITICGIVKRRWGEFSKGSKIEIDIVLKANSVQVDNDSSSVTAATPETKQMFDAFWEKYSEKPLTGRDLILKSFCPQIYGLYLVKLAIAVVLAGGSRVEDTTSTGVRTRSEAHLLLVGDPGTGKSQLLRFASKIIPRSVLTTGVGSTAAGLTVTAMMEHGEWHLEGGALVLSDGGICCIDEFNSMKEHDRTSIHEAMEQQTISVAKASIVSKLNTRCSILAACNPKGNLDVGRPLCMSIALPSPLLSRFDLILLLRDTVNKEWDTQIANYILNSGNKSSNLTESPLWSADLLQSYFAIVRKLNPKLSEDAEKILSAYYQMQRRIDSRNKARTTVRLLESLVRLSQGHAKLMCHKTVETVDSIHAIILVDAAMEDDSSILNLNMNTYSVFPEYPVRYYRGLLESVLGKLGLHQILEKEVRELNKAKDNDTGKNVKSRFFNWQDHEQGEGSGLLEFHVEELDTSGETHKNLNTDECLDDRAAIGGSKHLNRNWCQKSLVVSSDTHLVCAKNKGKRGRKGSNNETNLDKNKGNRRTKESNNETHNAKKSRRLESDIGHDIDFDMAMSSSSLPHKELRKEVNTDNRKNADFGSVDKRIEKACGSSDLKLNETIEGNKENNDFKSGKEVKRKIISNRAIKKPFDIDDIQLDLDLDEGYDTLSFGLSIDAKTKNVVCRAPSNGDISENITPSAAKVKVLNKTVSLGSENITTSAPKIEISRQDKNTDVPMDRPENNKSSASKIEVLRHDKDKNGNKTSANDEPGTTVHKTKEGIKSKLKKFKFVRKEDGSNKDEMNSENTTVEKKIDETCSKENTNSKKVQKENNSDNFVTDDLEMLKLIPSYNDDFNIDLEFDWDNIDAENFNLPKKTRNKLSKKSSSTMSRSSSSGSSTRRSIFQTSSEDVDDLDLDI